MRTQTGSSTHRICRPTSDLPRSPPIPSARNASPAGSFTPRNGPNPPRRHLRGPTYPDPSPTLALSRPAILPSRALEVPIHYSIHLARVLKLLSVPGTDLTLAYEATGVA